MGIPMGIPIPTAESTAAVGTEFLSPYGLTHPIPIPIPMGIPMGIPIPTADLHFTALFGLVCVEFNAPLDTV